MRTVRSTGKLQSGGSNEKMQMKREADNVQVHQMVAALLVEVLQGQRNDDEGAEGRGFAAE